MEGIYENRVWFRKYVPIFTVQSDGVLFQDKKYQWEDVTIRQGGKFASIEFKGKGKYPLNARTFRKMGEDCEVTFFGRNKTIEVLQVFLLHKGYKICDEDIESILRKRGSSILRPLSSILFIIVCSLAIVWLSTVKP